MYIEIKSKKITEVDSDYGSIRWQLGKLDDLDVLANGDVACVEGGEEHELMNIEHIKLVQNPSNNNNVSRVPILEKVT